MAHRHESRLLFDGPLVEVTDFRCADDDPVFGPEEATSQTQLAFVRSGCFERQVAGHARLVDGHHVAFFNAGEPFRVRHPVPGGDRCTVFTLRTDVLREALASARPEVANEPRPRIPWDQLPCSSDAFLLHAALVRQTLVDHPDALTVEELGVRLVEALVSAADSSPRETPSRAITARRHGELAAGARELLAHRLAEKLTLDDVSTALGCSPFHLARVFRGATGTPLHRYRMGLRLRASLDPVAAGEDLTGVALDHGFTSHGHFAHAFRTEFGVTPSRFRREARGPRLRELSKILEA
jgi:AraC-like DNA-binding protein